MIRAELAKPLVEALKRWLEGELHRMAPRGGLSVAIRHALVRRDALCRYIASQRASAVTWWTVVACDVLPLFLNLAIPQPISWQSSREAQHSGGPAWRQQPTKPDRRFCPYWKRYTGFVARKPPSDN